MLILEVDEDNSGLIEFDEFMVLLEKCKNDYEKEQFLRKSKLVFDMFDIDGGGTLQADELKKVL